MAGAAAAVRGCNCLLELRDDETGKLGDDDFAVLRRVSVASDSAGNCGISGHIDRNLYSGSARPRPADKTRCAYPAGHDRGHRDICLSTGMADPYPVGSNAIGLALSRPW